MEAVMDVNLIIRKENSPETYRMELCSNNKWKGGLKGTFISEEDFPENNLYLILEETGDTDPAFVESIVSHAARQKGREMELYIEQDNGSTKGVPLLSMERGEHSLSFYRLSVHQSL